MTPLPPVLVEHLAKPRPRRHSRRIAAAAAVLDSPAVDARTRGGGADPADRDAGQVTREGALSFQRPGLGAAVIRRLRRGLIPVDDELDLHGHTESEARDRLAWFLAESRDAGHRCVRIVHGKGYRSGARGPVLKSAVNAWLRRHLDVIAFVSARPIDGGTGALYVLLRR
ncbi:MAG TPA: Smr/MutS family protein [Steroidobacteraceae bacterium]|nr:Smr/MutS family protein [Steroidobacteraceae bacterium]